MNETPNCRVLLRRNSDGLQRWIERSVAPEHLDGQLFWYIDGNGSCDCNRGQFFDEAAGEYDHTLPIEEDNERYPCGDERYTMVRIELEDGRWASDAEPVWHAKG